VLLSAKNIYSVLCVAVMYGAEGSDIRKLLEGVLDGESNAEFGYESDLWSDRQSDSVSDSSRSCVKYYFVIL
jgi:hypothetical protein